MYFCILKLNNMEVNRDLNRLKVVLASPIVLFIIFEYFIYDRK